MVADAAAAGGRCDEIAFVDDRFPGLERAAEWSVVGRFDALSRLRTRFDTFVSAVGDSRLRLELIERARAHGFTVPPLVHPASSVSPYARLDEGVVVFAGAVVNIGARVAAGVIINSGATVDHDCQLAEGVHLCPGAHLAGDVIVGARTWFGIGAVAKQGIRIGADVTVGAGAVCLRDVPDGVTVIGIPARQKRGEDQ